MSETSGNKKTISVDSRTLMEARNALESRMREYEGFLEGAKSRLDKERVDFWTEAVEQVRAAFRELQQVSA